MSMWNDDDDYDDSDFNDDDDDDDEYDDFNEEEDEVNVMFADPGGESALRAATPTNPRIHPCPTCHEENKLTPADVASRYQCDQCADIDERGY